jgi:hypothetical protein
MRNLIDRKYLNLFCGIMISSTLLLSASPSFALPYPDVYLSPSNNAGPSTALDPNMTILDWKGFTYNDSKDKAHPHYIQLGSGAPSPTTHLMLNDKMPWAQLQKDKQTVWVQGSNFDCEVIHFDSSQAAIGFMNLLTGKEKADVRFDTDSKIMRSESPNGPDCTEHTIGSITVKPANSSQYESMQKYLDMKQVKEVLQAAGKKAPQAPTRSTASVSKYLLEATAVQNDVGTQLHPLSGSTVPVSN